MEWFGIYLLTELLLKMTDAGFLWLVYHYVVCLLCCSSGNISSCKSLVIKEKKLKAICIVLSGLLDHTWSSLLLMISFYYYCL